MCVWPQLLRPHRRRWWGGGLIAVSAARQRRPGARLECGGGGGQGGRGVYWGDLGWAAIGRGWGSGGGQQKGRMGSAFDGRDVRSGRSRALLARTSWRARLPCPSLSAVSPTAPPASRGVSKVGLRWSSLDLYGQRFSHFWRSPLVRAGRCPPLAAWRCALRSPFLALPPSDVHGCGSCNDGAAGPAADRFR